MLEITEIASDRGNGDSQTLVVKGFTDIRGRSDLQTLETGMNYKNRNKYDDAIIKARSENCSIDIEYIKH